VRPDTQMRFNQPISRNFEGIVSAGIVERMDIPKLFFNLALDLKEH